LLLASSASTTGAYGQSNKGYRSQPDEASHRISPPFLCNRCNIPLYRGGRITQMQYLLQLSWRTSENSVKAKFAEFLFHALR
jgi:hypothetical protein